MINFIEEKEANEILQKILLMKWDAWGNESWDNNLIHGDTIKNQDYELGKKLWDLKERIKEEIKLHYGIDQELYTEGLYCSRRDNKDWPITLHTDSNGNEFHSHGAVLYLNGYFEGGQLSYPDYGITLEPRPGTLVFHPSDIPHEVINLNHGMRYTMNIFWTYDESKNNDYI